MLQSNCIHGHAAQAQWSQMWVGRPPALKAPPVLYGSPQWSGETCHGRDVLITQECQVKLCLCVAVQWCKLLKCPPHYPAFYSSHSSEFRPVISDHKQWFLCQQIGKAVGSSHCVRALQPSPHKDDWVTCFCGGDEKWLTTPGRVFLCISPSCGLTVLSDNRNSLLLSHTHSECRVMFDSHTRTHTHTHTHFPSVS